MSPLLAETKRLQTIRRPLDGRGEAGLPLPPVRNTSTIHSSPRTMGYVQYDFFTPEKGRFPTTMPQNTTALKPAGEGSMRPQSMYW
jgi:hypothetical protein